MLGLNIFSLLVFTAINFTVPVLCNIGGDTRRRVLRLLCRVLLWFNVCRYTLSPLMGRGLLLPVEFSTVSYFSVPIIVLTGLKKLQSWASYSGIMAGFFYYMTMIVRGGSIYAEYPPYDIYISMCCHGILYLYGLVSMRTSEFNQSERCRLLGGVGGIALNAWLLRHIADKGERLFIYELMDGLYVKRILPEALWSYLAPVYYIIMFGLVSLTIVLFFRLNKAQYKKFAGDTRACRPVPEAVRALACQRGVI